MIYERNSEIHNVWDGMTSDSTQYPLTTGNAFLDPFSDECRFQYTMSINESLEDSLRHLQLIAPYDIEDYTHVMTYLRENKDIYLSLIDAIKAAADFFPHAHLVLSLHSDLECDDEYLLLNVGMEIYPEDLFDKFDALDERYMESLSKVESGWLTVMTHLIC